MNAIVNERSQPTTGTVNKVLTFLRKFAGLGEPKALPPGPT